MNQTTKMTFLREMKSRRGVDALILFHNGNSYEAYHTDAKIIAETLSLETFIEDALDTVRVPESRIEEYVNRLLDVGLVVCISDIRDESGNYIPKISMEDE